MLGGFDMYTSSVITAESLLTRGHVFQTLSTYSVTTECKTPSTYSVAHSVPLSFRRCRFFPHTNIPYKLFLSGRIILLTCGIVHQ